MTKKSDLAYANSLSACGELVARMMRGRELAHAKIVRGRAGWHISFYPAKGLLPPPDYEFEAALWNAVEATGGLSRRALGMKRALHDRVKREMAGADLWTVSERGAAPVACSTLEQRRAWLEGRLKK